jgi:hypothetical protein
MEQTIGSQVFGVWYNILGWAIASSIFFYLAVSADNLPPKIKERFPAIFLNKKFCTSMGIFFAVLAIVKFFN